MAAPVAGTAVTIVLAVAAAAALAGVWDLAENAIGFSALEGVLTELLWIGLGIAAAMLPAGLAALVVRATKLSPPWVVAAAVWVPVQAAIGVGLPPASSFVASAALVLACAWIATRRSPLAARLPAAIGIAAALVSAPVTAWLRPGYPAAPPPSVLPDAGARPNVVLIVLDTLRADHLGCYGDRRGLSPNLDAFAAQGTLFLDAFATAPWTVPSHASLFTGCYPRTHGATTVRHRWLEDRFTTLAEALKERGYATASFSANRYLRETNLLQGFDVRRPLGERFETLWIRPVLEGIGWPPRWADHGAREGVDAVAEYLDGRDHPDEPLFLFVNLMEPHWRYLPPIGDRARLCGEVGLARATRVGLRAYGPLLMATGVVEPAVVASVRALYAAAVRYQDRELGRLLDAIDTRLDPAKTIVVVTSDHGENLGEAGRFDHVFAVNDDLVHVPLVVRHPGLFPAGTRVKGLCQLVDVPTTIARLVPGARLGGGVAGRSLEGSQFAPRSCAIVEGDPYYGHLERMASATGFQHDVADLAKPLLAVRSRDRKLVLSPGRPPRLYDVVGDRGETQDVLGREAAAAEALTLQLDKWRERTEAYRPEDAGAVAPSPLGAEALERLQRMGYAGRDE